MIRVYAVTEPSPAPLPPGLAELQSNDLCAVFEPAAEAPPVTPEALWAHQQTVEALMADRALLPLRFGETAADESDLEVLLAKRGDELRRALARVRGCVELAARAPGGEDALRELARHARDASFGPAAGTVSYLVEAGGVDAFVAAVHEAQAEHPELAFSCTGPWPPYSFVTP